MSDNKRAPDKNADDSVTCDACDALCCRYTATQIDTPTAKRDYDFIRWYLLHRDVSVFIDHEEDWYLEFSTPCEMLQANQQCGIYEERPRICRQHGIGASDCEFHGATEPYRIRFTSAQQFEMWLDKQGIDWRFRDRKGREGVPKG